MSGPGLPKLVASYYVGLRNADHARLFMEDLADRLNSRVQLTTDGLRVYLEAIEGAFGADIDYAQLIKLYGQENAGAGRYSPPKCIGTRKENVQGKPDTQKVSTSHVERLNLTMRMSMRRFTRLTNGSSKKIENHECAIALHFMYNNFVRIHRTLKVTPAMEAGLTDRLWEIEDLVKLLEDHEKSN
jgi:IS1 family transposase